MKGAAYSGEPTEIYHQTLQFPDLSGALYGFFFSVRSFTDFFHCRPLCSSNLIFRSMFKAKNLPNNPEMTHEVNDIMHS